MEAKIGECSKHPGRSMINCPACSIEEWKNAIKLKTMEAAISINGNVLSEAQSMTVRVALETFFIDLSINGLGEDNHGKEITALYQKRIQEIRVFIFNK